MSGVEPANNKARILLAALVLLMLVTVWFGNESAARITQWVAADPDRTLERFDVVIAWTAVFFLPLLIAGIVTLRSGGRAVATERFPPKGMWVIVDTPVETGSRAKLRGRLLQLAGLFLCAVAIAIPIVLRAMVQSIAAAS
jgi:hypothetical protein